MRPERSRAVPSRAGNPTSGIRLLPERRTPASSAPVASCISISPHRRRSRISADPPGQQGRPAGDRAELSGSRHRPTTWQSAVHGRRGLVDDAPGRTTGLEGATVGGGGVGSACQASPPTAASARPPATPAPLPPPVTRRSLVGRLLGDGPRNEHRETVEPRAAKGVHARTSGAEPRTHRSALPRPLLAVRADVGWAGRRRGLWGSRSAGQRAARRCFAVGLPPLRPGPTGGTHHAADDVGRGIDDVLTDRDDLRSTTPSGDTAARSRSTSSAADEPFIAST